MDLHQHYNSINLLFWYFGILEYVGQFFGLVILSLGIIIYFISKKIIIAWHALLIFVVQVLVVAALDGEHSFVHFYYYVGTTFAFAIFLSGYLTKTFNWFKPFLILIIMIQFCDILNFEIGDYFTKHFMWSAQSRVAFYDECATLKNRNPTFPWGSGYVFNGPQTDNEQAADLGICFSERERIEGGKYGFYYSFDNMPETCQVIDSTEHINLVKCN